MAHLKPTQHSKTLSQKEEEEEEEEKKKEKTHKA